MFDLAHRHGNILREGWKNIMDSMLQLFRSELLPKAMVEVSVPRLFPCCQCFHDICVGRPFLCCPLLSNHQHCLCASGGGLLRAKWEDFSSKRGNPIQSVRVKQLCFDEGVPRQSYASLRQMKDLICAAVFPSGESAVLSFVTWLSGAEQSGTRGPSTENQEAKQAAVLCIKVRPLHREPQLYNRQAKDAPANVCTSVCP